MTTEITTTANEVDYQSLVLRFPLGDSIPISELPISPKLTARLKHLGWTETANFTVSDDRHLRRVLFPHQFDELITVMGKLRAEYLEQNAQVNPAPDEKS